MKLTWYIPVYEKGHPEGHGAKLGTTLYSERQEVFAFEPDAVDCMEVSGYWPAHSSTATEGEEK